MRVLHVVPSLGLRHGGVSVSVRELCRSLAQMGIDLLLRTTWRAYESATDEAADAELRQAQVDVRYFPVHPWSLLGECYAYSPALGASLRQEIPRVDLVHIHGLWLYPTVIASHLCRQSKVPYLVSPCGALDPYGMRSHRIFKRIYGRLVERKTLRYAAALHFTSQMEKERASRLGTDPPSFVIPRPIRLDKIPETPPNFFRTRHPEVGRSQLLLFLGRLHPKKRLDIAARAFVAVAQSHPDTHLVIAGPDDGAVPLTREILRHANLLERVTFTGLLTGSEKWAAFRESSLFLLPSEDENFGVSVLEAMAVGLPVLISHQVGLAPTLARAHAGIVLKINAPTWATAIEHLLEDAAARQEMSTAGRQLVMSEFSSERVAVATQEIYARILEGVQI